VDLESLKRKFAATAPSLNERSRRLTAAAEAQTLGYGGITLVSRASGVSRSTIARGLREIGSEQEPLPSWRIRRVGGGRKKLIEKDPALMTDLERLLESSVRGDPETPLRWTCKSLRVLTRQLQAMGHSIEHMALRRQLREVGFSLQSNRKTKEGTAHPDRNAQFEYINRRVRLQQKVGEPVISVDTKKKELVGDFKNSGREWRFKGQPQRVRVHDFMIPQKGKAIPYGVYDMTRNEGWVNLGIDHDTAAFAVNSIRRWWQTMGQKVYPKGKTLLITADSGGSNAARSRLWKWELQKLSDQTGLKIFVCHLPPGTSKWNKIEHRLFSFITQNWRGRPLTSLAVIISLIGATRTRNGLTVRAEIDTGRYPKGQKVTDEQLATILLRPERFHGDWNYAISPRRRTRQQARSRHLK
jgi:transposase